MSRVVLPEVIVPADATTLAGFRRWRRRLGEDAPPVHYLGGELYLDMNPQRYDSHSPVVDELTAVLRPLARAEDIGRYFGDRNWITNEAAELSNEPDGFLVLWETFEAGQARVEEESEVELVGRPDVVVEVVSASSATKDLETLRDRYARAGVPEYWIVDAREPDADPTIEILVLNEEGAYEGESVRGASVHSPVWKRSLRLRRVTDRAGPDYRLEVR